MWDSGKTTNHVDIHHFSGKARTSEGGTKQIRRRCKLYVAQHANPSIGVAFSMQTPREAMQIASLFQRRTRSIPSCHKIIIK